MFKYMLFAKQQGPEVSLLFYLSILLTVVAIVFLLIIGRFIKLWFQAFVSGVPIILTNIVAMSLRKIPPKLIVDSRITLYKAGLKTVEVVDLETHFLAGGDVISVCEAMIAASKANIELTWQQATAIDLAGRDIKDAVRTSVLPRVINCPDGNQNNSNVAVAKNGVELHCRARVTVRTNLAQLVGGATEETIVARVGEGIVSAIGSTDTHTDALEAPNEISKRVLEAGLDASTAFHILSIDIAKLDVGKNIGAILQAEQAETNKKIAQAKAEERRAMAVAAEQENKAKLVEAEALIPEAIADAYRSGNLGVLDGVRIGNIQADTNMRNSLKSSKNKKPKNEG
ncbi:flotillin-like protein FloA [Chlamydiia bacterium]|nr:flotillin-like protein FloA [Chlamydiia bacterium]